MSDDAAVLVEPRANGAYWDVILNRPKGNVIDSEVVEALTGVFTRARDETALKAICVSGAGKHFSFGASVQEHLPDQVAGMLQRFHAMFRVIADARITVLAAVTGQCLGGGLELAAYAQRLFASPTAKLGQPEIRLGVFAPVASALLAERVGRGAADHLCLSGEVWPAEDALAARLVDAIAEDPVQAAFAYFEQHLQPHSAASLRCAVHAARWGFQRRLFADLDEIEEFYLTDLQGTHDAVEGIRAFLDGRAPEWRNK